MSQRVAAIDISSRFARAVVLETTLRKTEVVGVHEVPVAAGSSREEVLRLLRAEIKGRVDVTVMAADAAAVSVHALSFPFGDLRRVDSAVGFELEGRVPYELEDTATSWHIVARDENSASVLAALTPKRELSTFIGDAERAGFAPRAIVPAASALAELCPHDDPEAVAILALGASVTHLAVVCKAELKQARTLRYGGDDVDRALSAEFGLTLEAASQAKEREAIWRPPEEVEAEARRLCDAIERGLDPLITALMTSFMALRREDMPVRVLITGGLSRLSGIDVLLSRRLGLAVERLDLAVATAAVDTGPVFDLVARLCERWRKARKGGAATASLALPAASLPVPPELAVALGLAIAVARHGQATPLDFRRGDLAYQGDLQLYRGQVKRLAIGLAVVISLAIAGAVVRYTMLAAEERRIDAGFCAATKKIVGREICDPTAALATLRQAPGAGDGVVIPSYSAAVLLEMMSKAIGRDIDVTFEDLELRVDGRASEPDRITGKGEAASFESTEQLAESLRRDPCVQEVDVGKQRKTRDGSRVEFNLTVKVGCPLGVVPGTSGARAGGAIAGGKDE